MLMVSLCTASMTLIPLHNHLFLLHEMSQAFKDHIWIQLGLCYIVKQILYLILMFGVN
jgi:hypothetical protein